MTITTLNKFNYNEQDNIRVPKLNILLQRLIDAEAITLDDTIEALAALTGAANKLPYFTGAETMALADFTAFARTVLDDPDAATARGTIGAEAAIAAGTTAQYWRGDKSWQTLNAAAVADLSEAIDDRVSALLVAGTGISLTYDDGANTLTVASTITQYTDEMARDALGTALTAGTGITITPNDGADTITVEISDAELTAIAGLTSAADRLPYFTGSGTAALATFTAAGRALVDDADAAAQRTTLGAAPLASPAFTGSVTATQSSTGGHTFTSQGVVMKVNSSNSNNFTFELQRAGVVSGYYGANATGPFLATPDLTVRIQASTTGMDVTGEARCDTLRIDVNPTAATPTPTHTMPVNCNGTVYRVPCVI